MWMQQCNAGRIAWWKLYPRLQYKPLDAAIGRVLALHCHSSRHGQRFLLKTNNTNKNLFLASYPRVDRSRILWEFWDPKQNLYSPHRCDKLHLNAKHHDWSWRARLHFYLSNVASRQKLKKLLRSSICKLAHMCVTSGNAVNNDIPWLFINRLPFWHYDASFPTMFLVHAHLNSTLTSSTYTWCFTVSLSQAFSIPFDFHSCIEFFHKKKY